MTQQGFTVQGRVIVTSDEKVIAMPRFDFSKFFGFAEGLRKFFPVRVSAVNLTQEEWDQRRCSPEFYGPPMPMKKPSSGIVVFIDHWSGTVMTRTSFVVPEFEVVGSVEDYQSENAGVARDAVPAIVLRK